MGLTACGGEVPEGASVDRESPTETPLMEDCEDGVDNDGDGRVDCEDGECSDLCIESCTNGEDDDGDALVDCEDDDCWGTEWCAEDFSLPVGTLISSVVMGGDVSLELWWSGHFGYGVWQSRSVGSEVAGRSIWGTARVLLPSASTSTTCSWSVDAVTWHRHDRWFSYDGSQSTYLRRQGLSVDEGCPLRSSAFLPGWLAVDDGRGVADGVIWYQGAVISSDRSTYYRTYAGNQISRDDRSSWQVPELSTGERFEAVVP